MHVTAQVATGGAAPAACTAAAISRSPLEPSSRRIATRGVSAGSAPTGPPLGPMPAVHSGTYDMRHCGGTRKRRPSRSTAVTSGAACSRSSANEVDSQTSRSSAVGPSTTSEPPTLMWTCRHVRVEFLKDKGETGEPWNGLCERVAYAIAMFMKHMCETFRNSCCNTTSASPEAVGCTDARRMRSIWHPHAETAQRCCTGQRISGCHDLLPAQRTEMLHTAPHLLHIHCRADDAARHARVLVCAADASAVLRRNLQHEPWLLREQRRRRVGRVSHREVDLHAREAGEGHLEDGDGDAAVRDVVARGDAAGGDEALRDVERGLQGGHVDVRGFVAELAVRLRQRRAAGAPLALHSGVRGASVREHGRRVGVCCGRHGAQLMGCGCTRSCHDGGGGGGEAGRELYRWAAMRGDCMTATAR